MNALQLTSLLTLRRQLRCHERWDRQQFEQHQEAALQTLRRFAWARSPFYREFHRGLQDAPLQALPVLTKSELMARWDEVVTDRTLRLPEVQAFLSRLTPDGPAPLFRGRYRVTSTAGSTGLRGIFLYDQREWTTVLASYARASDWAGLNPGLFQRPRVALVSTTAPWHQSALIGVAVSSLMPTLRVDSTAPPEDIVRQLNSFQPHSLVAYAGMARLLAHEQIAGRLNIRPGAVFCSSEVLTDDARRLVRDAWGAECFNVYAATETAGIASECNAHTGLHIYEDLVIVEVVDEHNVTVAPGSYGARLLATVLFSRTLPLIRYEISDSVRLASGPCPCHCPFAVIDSIQGRQEDVLHMPGTAGAPAAIQPNVFHDIMERFAVGGWQVVQEQPAALRVLVLDPGPGFSERALVEAITGDLAGRGVASPVVAVERVSSLRRGSIGKTPLIQAWKKPNQ